MSEPATLPLDSARWASLAHAYGTAADVPGLLRALTPLSQSAGEAEPWFSLWSALAHQGDVYTASFAAVPHVVDVAEREPAKVDLSFFQFPAWVEICRRRKNGAVPGDLERSYFGALSRLPLLVANAAASRNGDDFLCCALAALAASKGSAAVAEFALELTPAVAQEALEWFFSR